LNPLTPQSFPTGLVLGGEGSFFLSWDAYPGALCYSVYKADTSDPFGSYTIIAECIPNPPFNIEPFGFGCYRISAITANGETPLSLPTCSPITPPLLPFVVTDPADNILEASARLNGFVSPHGNTTTVHFEWGLTTAYGNVTGNQSVGVAETAFLAAISGLSASTTYHFRAVASNIVGTVFGSDESFMTAAPSGPCPSGGTPTPCDLSLPGAGVLGTITPPLGGGTADLGPLIPGNYTLKYLEGDFHDDGNPCPWVGTTWKFVNYNITIDGTPVLNWLDPILLLCSTSEANLAADVRAFRETYDFQSFGETWGINFVGAGGGNPVAGSPMATWQIIQNSVFRTDWPTRVRIVSFNAALFSVCAGPVSGNPAWDGTFPNFDGDNTNPRWFNVGAVSLNGSSICDSCADVRWLGGGVPGSDTGCGWGINIESIDVGVIWHGYKVTGADPAGCYVRDSGCSTGPASLTIETY
jgi:hypothetical protein